MAGDADSSGSAIPLGAPPAVSNPFDDDDAYDAGAGGGVMGDADASADAGAGGDVDSGAPAGSEGLAQSAASDAGGDGVGGGGGVAECAAVTAWRESYARGLEEKVAREREGKAERAAAARDALAKMHASWVARCGDAKEANEAAEREALRDRDGVLARMSKPGEKPNWSVVPELVDMSGKFKEGARDTSRMRQVLLKLKTY